MSGAAPNAAASWVLNDAQAAALRHVARCELVAGRTAEAVETLRVTASLRPDQAQTWRELAAALQAAGHARGAAAATAIWRAVTAAPDRRAIRLVDRPTSGETRCESTNRRLNAREMER